RPCSVLTRQSTRRPRRCPMRRAGTIAYWAPGNTRSPAAPARSSATSSASAPPECRRGRRFPAPWAMRKSATRLSPNQKHNPDRLVRQDGSEEAASEAIAAAVDAAFHNGSLAVDARGYYKQVFDVGGHPVTVSGRVVRGIVRIGSAWISPSTGRRK